MADMTQLTGAYAASWLPWIMIPMIFYILPFPVFAIIFLWIEREGNSPQLESSSSQGIQPSAQIPSEPMGAQKMEGQL
jgi:photosystem I subunit 8